MDIAGRQIALYGRFLARPRAEIARAVEAAGGRIVKDLTRATECLVVGAGATNFVANGHLADRLSRARARGVPVLPEDRFLAALQGAEPPAPTLPVDQAAFLPEPLLDLLNAFGLIHLADGCVRFADASVVKSAAQLLADNPDPLRLIAMLLRHREAPVGRHRLVAGADGEPMLAWEDGLTTLDGQGLLDLDPAVPLDDVFEAAMMAEAEGDLEAADRLYATCVRADRRDATAAFNRANVLMQMGDLAQAIIAYRQAIARDGDLAEAHYNLAVALERQADIEAARTHLQTALSIEPGYSDALFNLAQIQLNHGSKDEARRLFQRFLATAPSAYWTKKAEAGLFLAQH